MVTEALCVQPTVKDISKMSFEELEERLPRFCRQVAAEVAWAIAAHYYQRGDTRRTRNFAVMSRGLLRGRNERSLRECEPIHPVIGGIQLPEHLHDRAVEFWALTYWGIDLDGFELVDAA